MTKQLKETEDIYAEDFMGNVIVAGALIVYPSMLGRSPRLTLAEVISVKECDSRSYKYSIKVKPLGDSWGDHRTKQWKYDHEAKKGEYVQVEAKPVTLHFADRILVLT